MIAGFWRGLLAPSRLAALTVALVALGWVGLVPLVQTRDAVRRADERLAMIAAWDEYALLTGRILDLAERDRSSSEVVLLGTSVLLEGVSRPADLAAALASALGWAPAVHALSASGPSPLEYLAAIDGLAPTPGLVLLTPTFGYPTERYRERVTAPRFGFRSPAVDAYLRESGARPWPLTGVYALDNLPFFASRYPWILRNLAVGPPTPAPHAHLGERPFHGADPATVVAKMRAQLDAVDANFDANARLFETIVHRVRADGGEVVFVTGTVNPDYRAALASPVYAERLAAFTARLGVVTIDPQPDAALAPVDFNDAVHLGEMEAMERYTRALGRALAPLLAGRG